MSFLTNLVFNGEVLMLIVGMCSIISSDPGLVACNSSPSDKLIESDASASELRNELPNEDCAFGGRVRYCKRCKANVQGFDHHCPAFGNCVGQNNHRLFMVLLIGFIITEASYIVCSLQFATKSEILDTTRSQNGLTGNLASSTMLFSVLQMAWQVLFLMWHIYCVCFNIRTEEWINWKKYPEFHLSNESQTGNVRFRNPYHKGVLQNLKDFLALKG
ncbi:S-acyltransferase [Quillaja saponaria]|nr:S-acyltransferase [Quillaja saponaria]